MEIVEARANAPIAYPSEKRAAAVDAIANYLRLLNGWLETRYAVAGNGASVVAVPTRGGYIYCRLGDADGETIEARLLNLIEPANDDTLLVRRERPGGSGGWLVLDWLGSGVPPIRVCAVPCTGTVTLTSASSYDATGTQVVGMAVYPYAYAAVTRYSGSPSDYSYVYVLDVTDPSAPSVAGSANPAWRPAPTSGTYFLPRGMYLNGTNLYIFGLQHNAGGNDETCVKVWDVSTPSAPNETASLTITTGSASTGIENWRPPWFTVGSDLYVAFVQRITTTEYLKIVKVTPSAITETGSLTLSYEADAIAYQDGRVYLFDTNNDLLVIDVSTPSAPSSVTTQTGVTADIGIAAIASSAGLAVITQANELILFDLTDPDNPAWQSTTDIGEYPYALDVCGNFLYVIHDTPSAATTTVTPYDVADLASPVAGAGAETTSMDGWEGSLQIENAVAYVFGVKSVLPRNPYIGILSA